MVVKFTRERILRRLSRRQVLGGLTAAVAAAIAAGCQPAATTAPAPAATAAPAPAATKAPGFAAGTKVTMTVRAVFVDAANVLLGEQVKAWGQKNNVQASLEVVSLNDLQAKGATAAETGAGSDIMQLWVNTPHQFAEKLVDLDDIAANLEKKGGGWYDVAKQGAVVGGKWKAIPEFFSAHAVNYREDYFKTAGITALPKTWEELQAASKKLKDAKQPLAGMSFGHAVGDANNFLYSLMWAYGAAETAEDGKTVTINSDAMVKALEFSKSLYEVFLPDTISWDDSGNNRAFLAGQCAATNNAASIYAAAKKDAPDVYKAMNHFAYPAGPAGKAQYAEMHSLGIFKYSKSQDAAKDLIAYLMDDAQYSAFLATAETAAMPLLKGFEEKPDLPWNKDPKLAAFKGLGAIGRLPGYKGPSSAKAAEAFAKFIVVDAFAQAATNKKSPKDAAVWADDQLKQIYR